MARNPKPLWVSSINPGGRSASNSCSGNAYVSTSECRKWARTGIGCRFSHTHGWTKRPSGPGNLGASIPHRSFVIRLISSTAQAQCLQGLVTESDELHHDRHRPLVYLRIPGGRYLKKITQRLEPFFGVGVGFLVLFCFGDALAQQG